MTCGPAWSSVTSRAVAAIAREPCVRIAAAGLRDTPAGPRDQIARLEQLVHSCLVAWAPDSQTARWTPTGLLMLEHAEGILADLATASADLAQLDSDAGVQE